MAGHACAVGCLALLLLSSISSSNAARETQGRDQAASRTLMNDYEDVFMARVPAACTPSASSSTFTKVGCGARCQSCKRQATGPRDCVCCKPGSIPSRSSNSTCTACRVGTTARLAGSTSCTNCTRGLTTTRTAATICNGKQMSGTGLETAHSIQTYGMPLHSGAGRSSCGPAAVHAATAARCCCNMVEGFVTTLL
jgi:hypothetical protein